MVGWDSSKINYCSIKQAVIILVTSAKELREFGQKTEDTLSSKELEKESNNLLEYVKIALGNIYMIEKTWPLWILLDKEDK